MKISLCIVASAFIGASLYTTLTCDKCKPHKDYRDSLGPAQKKIYLEIVENRKNLYIQGLIFGLLVAFIYLWYTKNTVNPLPNSCLFSTIVLCSQYFYYTLMKKNKYMLNYLTNKDQIDGWLDVYKTMQNKYHIGMMLGIIGYILLGYGIAK